jgi:hypothetical protein
MHEATYRTPGLELLRGTLLASAIGYNAIFPFNQELDSQPPPQAVVSINPCPLTQVADFWKSMEFESGPKPGLELALERIQSSSEPYVSKHIENLVEQVSLPKQWKSEEVEPPTAACLYHAKMLLERLCREQELIPLFVAPSKVGGVFAKYSIGNHVLRVEIDNDLDGVAVLSFGKSVIASCVLDHGPNEGQLFAIFNAASKRSSELSI